MRRTPTLLCALVLLGADSFALQSPAAEPSERPPAGAVVDSSRPLLSGDFRWRVSGPLVAPVQRPEDPCYSVKDPTVVRHGDRWHLFVTIRSQKRSHQIEYLSFADWEAAGRATRHVLALTNGYFCAPQVFYFAPQRQWYLLYQVNDSNRKMLLPAFSTTKDLADPQAWTPPAPLYAEPPDNIKAWIDFWIICDQARAHLFFTSNNGLMWRAETRLADFPRGWSRPAVVLRGDIFEASHTYRLKGSDQFLTVVEAQGEGGRRYYKAWLADRLDGEWKPLAATREKPFAGSFNVRPDGPRWTDSISHGELLRDGFDQNLVVDPQRLQFLFQGVSDEARAGKKYGEIPWRLGLLTLETHAPPRR